MRREKIATPKLGAWLRMFATGTMIIASGAMRHVIHVMELDAEHNVQ
jgi:hypothetical protein